MKESSHSLFTNSVREVGCMIVVQDLLLDLTSATFREVLSQRFYMIPPELDYDGI
jgi:hypothetical protein